jgi:hypothetical protein
MDIKSRSQAGAGALGALALPPPLAAAGFARRQGVPPSHGRHPPGNPLAAGAPPVCYALGPPAGIAVHQADGQQRDERADCRAAQRGRRHVSEADALRVRQLRGRVARAGQGSDGSRVALAAAALAHARRRKWRGYGTGALLALLREAAAARVGGRPSC